MQNYLESIKKIFLSLIFLLVLISISTADEIKGFSKVVDGDTVHINNNKIRLNGIDAPEKKTNLYKI